MHMEVLGYNHRHDGAFTVDRPYGIDCWLFLVIKSPAIFRVSGEEIRVPGRSVIIYTPNTPQFYYPDGDVYYDDWMHCVPDADERALLEKFGVPLNMPVTFSSISDISAIMHNLVDEFYSSNINKYESSQLLFKLLIYKICEKYQSMKNKTHTRQTSFHESFVWNNISEENSSEPEKSEYFDALYLIREDIFRWPSSKFSIDDLAGTLSLSRSRFQHLYKQTFGKNISQDIASSRIQAAAKLLEETDNAVKFISVAVGYSSVAHFTKQFREAMGVTPIQYRKEKGKQNERSGN